MLLIIGKIKSIFICLNQKYIAQNMNFKLNTSNINKANEVINKYIYIYKGKIFI